MSPRAWSAPWWRAATLSVLATTAGCSTPSEPLPNGIAMVATASKNIITRGTSAQVTFTLENGSAADITFSKNVCPGLIEVTDLAGTVVYSSENLLILCALEVEPVTLKPGSRYSWSEAWDGSGINTVNRGQPGVAPGTYHVRARLRNFTHLGDIDNRAATVEVR